MRRVMDKESQNEEVMDNKILDTIKFYYGMTTEQYKHVLSELKSDREQQKKEMTVMTAIITAILVLFFWIRNHLK